MTIRLEMSIEQAKLLDEMLTNADVDGKTKLREYASAEVIDMGFVTQTVSEINDITLMRKQIDEQMAISNMLAGSGSIPVNPNEEE